MSQQTDSTESETAESAPNSETNGAGPAAGAGREYPVTATPTVRPTLVWLAIVGLGGGALTGLVVSNPGFFGGTTQANVVGNAILLLTGIGLVRFLIRVYVLQRTEYVVDERSLIRRYSLLLRTWRREVPLTMVRSHQLEQGRIQKLLGYGTISVNQGLGDIRFENVRDPTAVNEVIAEQVSQAAGRGHDGT